MGINDKMVSKPFDPTKPVQTREGHSVRIVDTNIKGNSGLKLLVVTTLKSGIETYGTRHLDGSVYGDGRSSQLDLVNIPEREVRYINLYKLHNTVVSMSLCKTGEHCDQLGNTDRKIGQIKITYEDGIPIKTELM